MRQGSSRLRAPESRSGAARPRIHPENVRQLRAPLPGASDALLGGGGDDYEYAGHGDDQLQGGDDDDVLEGDGGDDELSGGRATTLRLGNIDTDRCATEIRAECERG